MLIDFINDQFFSNLHYFKIKKNILLFNQKEYIIEIPEELNKSYLISLYNEHGEEMRDMIYIILLEISKDLKIIWHKSSGFDGTNKYVDQTAYIEYFNEKLFDLRRSTVKTLRFYNEEEEDAFLSKTPETLYDLVNLVFK